MKNKRTHIDYFKDFFKIHKRGTASEICEYLIEQNAKFNNTTNPESTSVNSHLRREVGKSYQTGILCREKNSNEIYEYFTKQTI
jgi:hypothetical protein